eukprot:TRINITY_DN8061_c0_g1_i1.p1 TRINITY_DN8061_c0_g1~~TRINITY_DN8061_c0_g1_i1.p1  ORF type:complete len:322 (+),score=59.01 TRINITY_DN8061_c0_g1_i1:326-1291(+)
MRRTLSALCPSSAGWLNVMHKPYNYPELADTKMWRTSNSEAHQPVLILSGEGGLEKLGKLCKNMDNPAGCAAIELPQIEANADWLERQADLVLKYINVLGSPWVHVVGHSVGALLAVYLGRHHPLRVGSLVIIDTPIATPREERLTHIRNRLLESERDVNITDEEIADLKEELQTLSATDLPKPPLDGDVELFQSLVKESWTVPFGELPSVRQPMLVARPATNAFLNNESLKTLTNTFFVKEVKDMQAGSHDELLSNPSDLAYDVDLFHSQYLTQTHVETMWEGVKSQRLEAASKMGKSGGGDKGGGEKGKSKKKKGKKQQ